jgi:bifunctional enzyme CysN/CysC
VLTQTRRHSYLVHLLGIRNLVLAINKMDLVDYDEARFDAIVEDYRAFVREAGIEAFTAIPVSGLVGDNVTASSGAMPWYEGPSLLEHLETVPVDAGTAADEPFRMTVQWVNRPDQNFRGYSGRVASGCVRVGDEIAVLPAGRTSAVARIVTFDSDLEEAIAGQSVTLTLADQVDCSRGDTIAAAAAAPESVTRIEATLVWMADEAMVPHRSYWLKIGTQTLSASVGGIGPVIDVNTMEQRRGLTLGLNDIGQVEIDLDRRVLAVRYKENRQLGGFILIDKVTHATVAAGLVTNFPKSQPNRSGPRGEGSIVWVAGDARSDYAAQVQQRLKALGRPAFVLDETTLRELVPSLPEGEAAREETIHLGRNLAKLMARAGVRVLVTLDAAAEEAHPGQRVEATASEQEGADEWVI